MQKNKNRPQKVPLLIPHFDMHSTVSATTRHSVLGGDDVGQPQGVRRRRSGSTSSLFSVCNSIIPLHFNCPQLNYYHFPRESGTHVITSPEHIPIILSHFCVSSPGTLYILLFIQSERRRIEILSTLDSSSSASSFIHGINSLIPDLKVSLCVHQIVSPHHFLPPPKTGLQLTPVEMMRYLHHQQQKQRKRNRSSPGAHKNFHQPPPQPQIVQPTQQYPFMDSTPTLRTLALPANSHGRTRKHPNDDNKVK